MAGLPGALAGTVGIFAPSLAHRAARNSCPEAFVLVQIYHSSLPARWITLWRKLGIFVADVVGKAVVDVVLPKIKEGKRP